MAIEIFQNTLLKLIVRNGPDSDRINTKLSLGEVGWTTDTKRFYVGDGETNGGILVGNVFKGSVNDITSLAPAAIGDTAYDFDDRKFYRLQTGSGSLLSDWQVVGGVYAAGNGIAISSNNTISTAPISAGSLSQDSVVSPLLIDGNGRLSLSASIAVDKIVPKTGSSLELPRSLVVAGQSVSLPASYPINTFLQVSNVTGDIIAGPAALSAISTKTLTFTNGLTAYANGSNVTGVPVNPLSANIIVGLSPTLSSVLLAARYNGNTNTLVYAKGVTSVTKLGVGNYQFNYPSTVANLFPSTQMFGLSNITFSPRIDSISNTACIVRIVNASLASVDGEISLKLEA